ncbi:MAG: hypothetical protein HIU93_13310 [Acidobacteria bacterium]|nr:hypothetical protein [Acidobacteriota bacterium]MBW4046263.1 hypothetical protein [Acidobacteriota bacterium]
MRVSLKIYHCFFWLTVFCVAVPGFAPLKAMAIFSVWLYIVIKGRMRISSTIWFLAVCAMITVWSGISILKGFEPNQVLDHGSRILLFFLVLAIGAFAAQKSALSRDQLDSLLLVITTGAMLLKILILIGVLTGFFTLETAEKTIGFETVTDSIGLGLLRLQFPSDIIILFLLPCYLGGRRRWKDILFLIGISGVVLLSFSRFLFAAYLICIFLRAFWIKRSDFVSRTGIVVTTILVLIFSASLLTRFAGEGSSASDETRTEQIAQMDRVILSNPFFGTGIGSHVPNYKRSDSFPFFYEVQWYAMTMQMGAIGISLFVALLGLIIFSQIDGRRNMFYSSCIFMLWFIAGFTNPYITSLGSGFGFAILLINCRLHTNSPVVRQRHSGHRFRSLLRLPFNTEAAHEFGLIS